MAGMDITRRTSMGRLAVLTGAPLGAAAAAPASRDGERLLRLLDEAHREDAALDPQAALLRGDRSHAHEFGDSLSDAALAHTASLLRRRHQRLRGIARERLGGPVERMAYDLFEWQTTLELRRFEQGHARLQAMLAIDQLFGQHVAFQQFSSGEGGAPFDTVRDFDDGLRRLEGFVQHLDLVIARMRQGLARGLVHPRVVVERVLEQLDAFIATPTDDCAFLAPLRRGASALPPAEAARLNLAYRQAVDENVRPAYRRLAGFLRHEYAPRSRAGAPGLLTLPGGRAYYAHQLETMTTLKVEAARIHRLGLAEVARIRADMEAVRREMGFDGPLSRLFEHLRTDPRHRFEGPEALLQAYRELGRRVDGLLPQWFEQRPRSALEVRPTPLEQQSAAGGAYYQPGTADGSRPGVFYVNTADPGSLAQLRVTALYLHEAMPGHHLQGSLAAEAEHLPPLLRHAWNTGYGEGWALYAEWLGQEMGLYTDPVQRFGALDMEMFRALRMVVDTGLHAFGWTAAQAVERVLADTALERSYVQQEVERYIAWPGQAVAYKLGELTLKRLRRHAQQRLGARFDVRGFHAQVLGTGALPLAVLERKIVDWVSGQQ